MKPFSVLFVSAALAIGAVSCQRADAPSEYSQKVVILGFDGMDPELTEQWMAEGQLPHLSRLAAQGGFTIAAHPAYCAALPGQYRSSAMAFVPVLRQQGSLQHQLLSL